jgi:hypothetical protein
MEQEEPKQETVELYDAIDLINWLQRLIAKKFYSDDAEDLIKEFKKK